jgi:hypothetical protein
LSVSLADLSVSMRLKAKIRRISTDIGGHPFQIQPTNARSIT